MSPIRAQKITAFAVLDLCGTAGTVIGGYLNGRNGAQLLLLLAVPSVGMGITAVVLALLARARQSPRAQNDV